MPAQQVLAQQADQQQQPAEQDQQQQPAKHDQQPDQQQAHFPTQQQQLEQQQLRKSTRQPDGYQQGGSGMAYKLRRAIYGLEQASRAWHVELQQVLVGVLGYTAASADLCKPVCEAQQHLGARICG